MAHMIVRHKVSEFDVWKRAFEDHDSAREAAGLKALHVWRNDDDPSEILILLQVSDMTTARDFAGSADLKESMEAAGVQGIPELLFLSDG